MSILLFVYCSFSNHQSGATVFQALYQVQYKDKQRKFPMPLVHELSLWRRVTQKALWACCESHGTGRSHGEDVKYRVLCVSGIVYRICLSGATADSPLYCFMRQGSLEEQNPQKPCASLYNGRHQGQGREHSVAGNDSTVASFERKRGMILQLLIPAAQKPQNQRDEGAVPVQG